jgi:deoxyribonuclease-1
LKTTLAFLLLATISTAFASGESTYYPTAFVQAVNSGSLKDQALKAEINKVLSSTHLRDTKGGADTLGCASGTSSNCYEQLVLGYDGARKVLFGKIHLQQANGQYSITDVYCHKTFTGNDIRPNIIPNHSQINCEHTWPQSKFTGQYPKEMQKSDLNHLFPTDSKANSVRGNFDFADVSDDNGNLGTTCEASKSGSSSASNGDNLFEPPTEHKGNVARALFYFSVRYKIQIPASEEQVLRRWNDLDPVDDAERDRNEQVYKAQNNRNPFIDFPQLANYINKF